MKVALSLLLLVLSGCSATHKHLFVFKAHVDAGIEVRIGDTQAVQVGAVCAVN